MQIATCRLVLYTYQQKNRDKTVGQKYPVRLRVTFQRITKYYSLKVQATEKEFDKLLHSSHLRDDFQVVSHYLNKASKIIRDLGEDFSWHEFEMHFFGTKKTPAQASDLFESFQEYADRLKNEGRIKTFQTYQGTLNRLRLFHPKKRLSFLTVTPEWLSEFSASLRSEGLRLGSVRVHTQNIRTIFNREIAMGRLDQNAYPFGRNKFKPPSSSRVKKALTLEEIDKIFNYTPASPTESWCRDMWLFSYLGNGMNIKDLALLKFENIVGTEIHFVRAKTQRKTMDNQRMVHVHIHPHMEEIIRRWGNPDKSSTNYIFKIMGNEPISPMQETRNVNQAVKNINKYMKRIGMVLGLSKLPTCNFARHSYSTVLKRANVPIEVISEALGHFSVKTTEIYLDSFESDKRAEISKLLLPNLLPKEQPVQDAHSTDQPGGLPSRTCDTAPTFQIRRMP